MNSMDNLFKPSDKRSKIRGETLYLQDVELPGQLHGAVLRSPHAHSTIRRIDVSKASEVEGVKKILTCKDVQKIPYGPTRIKDWNILADDRVLFVGDEVAAVVAATKTAALRALSAIKVEYEPLPAVFTPEEALGNAAPRIHHERANEAVKIVVERGDVNEALSKASVVRGGRFVLNRVYHAYMEPTNVIADWDEVTGLTLLARSHIPYMARELYASALGLPISKVRIVVPPFGGSFGHFYISKSHVIAAALAIAAHAPVKLEFDRHEDMLANYPRVPLTIDIKIGTDIQGNFVGKSTEIYADAGARVFWSPNVLAVACTRIDSLYNFHNVKAVGHLCYTNNSPTTCMRGFGMPDIAFAVESTIDELAKSLKMDPLELRRRNIVHKNETTMHGYRLDSCELEECLTRVAKMAGWERREQLPPNHGLGIGLAIHVSGFRPIEPRYEGSTAIARLNPTGEIEIETGEIDVGEGLSETYATIAANQLGIAPTSVRIKSGDTAKYPLGIGTLASRGTVLGGNAVSMAAQRLKSAINHFAKQTLGIDAQLVKDGIVTPTSTYSFAQIAQMYEKAHHGQSMLVEATYIPHTDMPDAKYYGNPSPAYPFAAHIAEVEVDPETGRTKVVAYWAAHDSGVIIDHISAQSQVIGGITQGIGGALLEELVLQDGRIGNPSMMDYRIPGFDDVPQIHVDFVQTPDPNGPMGAKSLAEVALDPSMAAIANAISHATGRTVRTLPATAERVWKIIHELGEQTS